MSELYIVLDTDDHKKVTCYTEEEKNIMINYGIIEKSRFSKVRTVDDLNKCMKNSIEPVRARIKHSSYLHPRCNKNRIPIIKKLESYSSDRNDIFMSSYESDMSISNNTIETKRYGYIYPSSIKKGFTDSVQEKANNVDKFTMIIKVANKPGELYHTFTVFVNIESNNIKRIFIVDTANYNGDYLAFARTIAARSGIKLASDFSEFHIDSMFNDSGFNMDDHPMGLQDGEKQLNAGGYCGAWSLYFIYNFIRLSKDSVYYTYSILTHIYEYLAQNRDIITPMIISWWDNISRISEPSEWENIDIMDTLIPPIVIDDEGDSDMSDDDYEL